MTHEPSHRRHGRTLAVAILGAFLAGIAVTWGWNTMMAGLGGLPEARFVHGLATVTAVAALAATAAFAARLTLGRPPQ